MSVNLPVIVVTFAMCFIVAPVSACSPLLQSRRIALVTALQETTHGTDGKRSTSATAMLLAVQVGLAVVLTTAAGLISVVTPTFDSSRATSSSSARLTLRLPTNGTTVRVRSTHK
jgi:hypothetical protein